MRRMLAVSTIASLCVSVLAAQRPQPVAHITSPKDAFGFDIGDDYRLANYTQIEAYWKTLAKESNRLVLHDMGRTAEGRTQWMAIVTSPENHKKLAHYQDISKRLGFAEG